jgi:predicted patatin/cPLA2 family phospholipase
MESTAAKLPAKRALVVEGNAMRGIFSAGVLDSFLDTNIGLSTSVLVLLPDRPI